MFLIHLKHGISNEIDSGVKASTSKESCDPAILASPNHDDDALTTYTQKSLCLNMGSQAVSFLLFST